MDISSFQSLIRNLYYHQDLKRGIEKTFMWLIEEIGELSNVLKEENLDKEKISEEIADVIAWTTSLANLLEIDVERALIDKYPNICAKCGSNPCCCNKF
jgi:NTP pyrophosphatase (non-canonical NTP hydrolase)